jgi:hypothetical protein
MRIRTDLAVLLCFCPWQIAQADEGKVRSAFVVCGGSLAFFGWEGGCAAFWYPSPFLSTGVRYVDTKVMDDESNALVLVGSWMPMAGSFHIDLGMGAGRVRDSAEDPWVSSLALHTRLGNRWDLPFGLTLGIQYLGFEWLSAVSSSVLILQGAEVGWTL